jgi:hypothetical protein
MTRATRIASETWPWTDDGSRTLRSRGGRHTAVLPLYEEAYLPNFWRKRLQASPNGPRASKTPSLSCLGAVFFFWPLCRSQVIRRPNRAFRTFHTNLLNDWHSSPGGGPLLEENRSKSATEISRIAASKAGPPSRLRISPSFFFLFSRFLACFAGNFPFGLAQP